MAGKRKNANNCETPNRLSGKLSNSVKAATKGSLSLALRSAMEQGNGGTSPAISCQPRVKTAFT